MRGLTGALAALTLFTMFGLASAHADGPRGFGPSGRSRDFRDGFRRDFPRRGGDFRDDFFRRRGPRFCWCGFDFYRNRGQHHHHDRFDRFPRRRQF